MNRVSTIDLLKDVIRKNHLLKKEEMINKVLNEPIFSDNQQDPETRKSETVLHDRRK